MHVMAVVIAKSRNEICLCQDREQGYADMLCETCCLSLALLPFPSSPWCSSRLLFFCLLCFFFLFLLLIKTCLNSFIIILILLLFICCCFCNLNHILITQLVLLPYSLWCMFCAPSPDQCKFKIINQ